MHNVFIAFYYISLITCRADVPHAAGQRHEEAGAPVAEPVAQLLGREGLQRCSGSAGAALRHLLPLLSLHKGMQPPRAPVSTCGATPLTYRDRSGFLA